MPEALRSGRAAAHFLHGDLTDQVLASAIEVHKSLGPGLLESAYKACLAWELGTRHLAFVTEQPIPVRYKGIIVETGYRADLIVEGKVLVELKSIERLQSVHEAQLLTYLRLSGIHVGLVINFNVNSLKNGIRRFVR